MHSENKVHTLDIDDNKLYYLSMKAHAQYITDEKGKKKAVILDLKEYEKLIHALEDLEDKKAFLSVAREKAIPYGEIESRLKKSKRL
jgi:trimethylamine:corrinoid methyltransferase-like protein